jgi:hypothetical protein
VVQLGTDGKLRSSLFWHGDVNSRLTSPGTVTYNDGRWHLVAVTYANGVESLYIDGTLAGQQNVSQTPYASAYSYYLGTGYTAGWSNGNGGWQFFAGTLDEAAIYQRALTAAEVGQHYAAVTINNPPVTPPSTTPTAQYHFGEASGTSAADSTGNSQMAVYVGNPTLNVAGVSGTTAVRLNGSNQYVALPSAPFGVYGNPVSFETWFSAPVGASGVILSQTGAGATPGGGSPNGYVPVVQLGTDGKLRSSMFWHGDVNARLTSPGATTYNDGRWHHVAVTYANGVESLYIDGALAGRQTFSDVPYATAYSYFLGTGYTGGWAAGNGGWQFFSGTLDEAAIYQRALSAAEVAQHYAAASSSLAKQTDAALVAAMSEWTLGLPTTSPANRRI